MKICTVGNGLIVPWFLDAAKKVEGVEVIAACGRSGSVDKLSAIAEKYDIPLVYLGMEYMLKNPEIDTVYLGIANHVHYAYARQALLAGKNVIIEKPFTATYPQARALADLAEEKGLFLFEAAPNRYFPSTLKMKDLLPRIGTPRLAVLNYSQYSSRYNVGDRQQHLKDFCKEQKINWNSIEAQLAFAIYELSGADPIACRLDDYLKETDNSYGAAAEFAAGFERCITDTGKRADRYTGSLYPEFYGNHYQGLSRRINKAMNYYIRFVESDTATSTP